MPAFGGLPADSSGGVLPAAATSAAATTAATPASPTGPPAAATASAAIWLLGLLNAHQGVALKKTVWKRNVAEVRGVRDEVSFCFHE